MKYSKIYLLGIGGIGMSALARYFKHQGSEVAGYDLTSTRLTQELESEGISVHFNEAVENIPKAFRNKKETLVIYTPAVPTTNREYQYFVNEGFELVKRSAVLGHIASSKMTLAVAGTHGKTTTSTILAHLLKESIGGCSAFLGGISKNYDTNLLLSTNDWLVVEADEYDRSFLQLFPQSAVITSADPDHLDIYGTEEEVKKSFGQFASQISADGELILKLNTKIPMEGVKAKVFHYSLETPCDYYASNIRSQSGGFYLFDLNTPKGIVNDCKIGIPGLLNVENGVAAMALALTTGADVMQLKKALANFKGVRRRMDFYINTPQVVYLDDYAHHPEELKASIGSIRKMFPDRKITGIFQPHLYTRTRDFDLEFAESLNGLDSLILLDIYPARELPIEGVSSKIIFDKVNLTDKILCSKGELIQVLKNKKIDVLVTFGAGDIDKLCDGINRLLSGTLGMDCM